MIAAYILVQTQAGKAAMVAAAPRMGPASWTRRASPGPCDVMARAQAHNTGELARLETSRVQALPGRSPVRN
jgi:hypothetical protein